METTHVEHYPQFPLWFSFTPKFYCYSENKYWELNSFSTCLSKTVGCSVYSDFVSAVKRTVVASKKNCSGHQHSFYLLNSHFNKTKKKSAWSPLKFGMSCLLRLIDSESVDYQIFCSIFFVLLLFITKHMFRRHVFYFYIKKCEGHSF